MKLLSNSPLLSAGRLMRLLSLMGIYTHDKKYKSIHKQNSWRKLTAMPPEWCPYTQTFWISLPIFMTMVVSHFQDNSPNKVTAHHVLL